MSQQIVATPEQIEGALKGTGLSKQEFLRRLVKQKSIERKILEENTPLQA